MRCEHGLHARVASRVVQLALNHEATMHIHCAGCPRANACSILELMRLGAVVGTRLHLVAEGADEDVLIEALTGVLQNGDGI